MGQTQSLITQEDLEEYQDCTFFSKKEIIHVHKRFTQLTEGVGEINGVGGMGVKVALDNITSIDELKNNPFAERMCHVFSEDGSGDMTFEDFLDMCSVFSEGATRDVKSSYAFRIYDFDMDGYLGREDLKQTVEHLVGSSDGTSNLKTAQVDQVVTQILSEADLDGDEKLSYVEFEHIVSRAPDFSNTFRIRI